MLLESAQHTREMRRDEMNRRQLGATGLSVSPLGMGAIQITRLQWDESLRVVREVVELGINWIDTAHDYLDSEKRLGEALRGLREEIVLITKSGSKDPKGLQQDIEESLRRLKTDYLDVFLFHGGDAIVEDGFLAPGGLLEVADRARTEGKIRHLGFSAHRLPVALKGLEVQQLEVAMVPANFISREYIEGPFMQRARGRRMAVLAMKPFGGGRMRNPAICLKFLKGYPDLFPCIGIERRQEMVENIAVWESPEPLQPSEVAELERQARLLGDRFCRGCGYCLPCPEGIPIDTVTFFRIFSMQMPREEVVTPEHTGAAELAKGCTECRQCVQRCPFELDIPAMLKENVHFYEQFAAGPGDPRARSL
jgi:predicted aldo/keto reductase-like oxidoreductase